MQTSASSNNAAGESPPAAGPDLNVLFDLSPLPLLILSPTWRITKASASFLTAWHANVADCVGRELLPFIASQLQPSGAAYISYVTAAMDDAIAARSERTTRPIDTGRNVSWRARIMPIFNQAELVAIVTEWHEGPSSTLVQEDLVTPGLSTDEAFRILVQAVKDYAIFLLDTKGRIATWNTGAELLKGYKRDEIVGKHFSIFYGKEDLEIKKPQMELEICMREGRVEDEGWRYKKDGTRFWANVIITAVYKDGVHVGFGKVTRDLTERKSAESRLIAAYEESEKLKSDFLANMSHEIRTPMHGMLAACTLLLDTPLNNKQREIAGIMDESGKVLLQVINDILDYSKLASGSFSIHSDIVGVTSIVTSVVRSVQTTLQPSVHFELFLAPELPRSVQGDPLRYRQILQNIVSNAAKFTEKGSIRVRASVEKEDSESYTVLTEVTDTGIGIPEAAAAGLFTPFTQYDLTTTKQYKGTGLGLSIAKSLTELMGGRIGYRPNPERHGSTFWFTARFKKIKSLGQIQEWKQKLTAKDGSMSSFSDVELAPLAKELERASSTKSLLLVEDNIINQKVMLGMLRSLGFRNTALASNGVEAVNMVKGKPAAYDLVLMDINMPVLDGHEATRRIRDHGIHVPIVAMTAYALKGDRDRCLEHGMDDYIAKPVDKKHLIKTLGKWLLQVKDYRKSFDEQLTLARLSGGLPPHFSTVLANGTHPLAAQSPAAQPPSAQTSVAQTSIPAPTIPAGEAGPPHTTAADAVTLKQAPTLVTTSETVGEQVEGVGEALKSATLGGETATTTAEPAQDQPQGDTTQTTDTGGTQPTEVPEAAQQTASVPVGEKADGTVVSGERDEVLPTPAI